MSDQTVINPTSTLTSSPAEDFANEVATPVAAPVEAAPVAAADAPPAAAATQSHDASQAFSEGVKDFGRAFSFVEQGVIKLGDAAKDELIELARKYL
ncbi:hypothetical protein [Pantoea sp. CTOTU46764]|uniref:hypothetical protein n=1 Tax=Pantoea sp. CTOTU46764 TaxID=2953854 RepID=UPI0028993719|nr:hypothetical protein [Pantoea sp. CTOTU46764]